MSRDENPLSRSGVTPKRGEPGNALSGVMRASERRDTNQVTRTDSRVRCPFGGVHQSGPDRGHVWKFPVDLQDGTP